jgi:broad specificity phosphatase PhoE
MLVAVERLLLFLTAAVPRTVLSFTADRPFLRVDNDRSAVILNPRRASYMPTVTLSLDAGATERSVLDSETIIFNAVNSKSTLSGNSNATVAETPEHGVTTTTITRITPPRFTELESSMESTSLSENTTTVTTVYGIRHGTSVSNEWMTGPNAWGAPTYDDRLNIRDSPLSAEGIAQATALCRTWQEELKRRNSDEDDDDDDTPLPHWLSRVQLIVLSPLTRCLQTYQYAIQPLFSSLYQQHDADQSPSPPPVPRVVVQPLLAERLYTRSETGRPVSALRREFPGTEIDWSLLPEHNEPKQQPATAVPVRHDLSSCVQPDGCWWYHPLVPTRFTANVPLDEWRPHGQGQVYGDVAGEPSVVFERRMQALSHWLHYEQPETCILTVGHWGVYRHLASIELDNGQMCSFTLPQQPANDPTKLPTSSL